MARPERAVPARTSAEDPRVHRTFALFTAAFVAGMLLLAVAMAIASPDSDLYRGGYAIFIALDVLFMPLSVVSAVYLWRIYSHDHRTRRSWLLLRDALLGTAWTTITVFVGALTLLRLVDIGPFDWSPPFVAVAVVLASSTTTYMAAVYWLRRRASGDGTPPPIND